jgi:hypothetical protein
MSLTARERIIEALEIRAEGICDDCLSESANVKPRQQVNTICRNLQQAGILRRDKAICSEGCIKRPKIINRLIGLNDRYQPKKINETADVRDHQFQFQLSNSSAPGRLDSFRRKMIEIMNDLDPHEKNSFTSPAREGFSDRLTRLAESGIIPMNIVIAMRMLNAMRNAAIYHRCPIDDKDEELIDVAFQNVLKWWNKNRISAPKQTGKTP